MKLRKAVLSERSIIWKILEEAIEQRRSEGSQQWQDGYPNEQSVIDDIANGYGYVLFDEDRIVAYSAIIFDGEPAYEAIRGKWLTDNEYVVLHRVATAGSEKKKGIATILFQMIEDLAIEHEVYSIKVDTNFDNIPMMRILDKLNYVYCGEVFFRGAARKAYEKVLPR